MTHTRSWAARVGAALAGLMIVASVASPAAAQDTVRQAQWYLDALNVPAAQQITRGEGVIVGVVDSVGVDATHPDLAGQVLPGTGFGVGASPNGWSSTAGADHATHMAGIIAAKGGAPTHALGIAPGVKILPVAINPDNASIPDDISQAIRWAVDHGAKVINISISGNGTPDQVETDAIRYALDKDVVVVAGAGNASVSFTRVGTPASVPGVVAVSGYDRTSFWSGSVSGPQVTIAAPAVGIVNVASRSQYPAGYETTDGTSDATAIVTGTVALIRAKYPNLNAANVINRLITTAKDQGTPGRDDQTGYGTVRVYDALTKDVPPVTANPLGSPTTLQSATTQPTTGDSTNHSTGIMILIGGSLLATIMLITLITAANARNNRRRTPPPPTSPPYW